MKLVYSSVISTAFAVTDSVSSHVVVFTAYHFGILFVALVALSLFLVKAYNRRRPRLNQTRSNKSRCFQAIEYSTKQNTQTEKLVVHKKQQVREEQPKLSRKAKKRLRAAANGKKVPLPVTSVTQQPDRDDILRVIKDVSNQHIMVECKEKKATSVKKVRKVREINVQNVSLPVIPIVSAAQPVAVKTATSSASKADVPNNVHTKNSRRPMRRPITLNDYILRKDMHLAAYVQTYRV